MLREHPTCTLSVIPTAACVLLIWSSPITPDRVNMSRQAVSSSWQRSGRHHSGSWEPAACSINRVSKSDPEFSQTCFFMYCTGTPFGALTIFILCIFFFTFALAMSLIDSIGGQERLPECLVPLHLSPCNYWRPMQKFSDTSGVIPSLTPLTSHSF